MGEKKRTPGRGEPLKPSTHETFFTPAYAIRFRRRKKKKLKGFSNIAAEEGFMTSTHGWRCWVITAKKEAGRQGQGLSGLVCDVLLTGPGQTVHPSLS